MVEDRAREVARARLQSTGHSMALEAQAVSPEDEKEQLEAIVRKLVEKSGSELWKDDA